MNAAMAINGADRAMKGLLDALEAHDREGRRLRDGE